MKELSDIIAAYSLAIQSGTSCALATVVHVEGSSYRRPGARMLVTDDGRITGAISGGCLEGDALRKALLAISEGRNRLVTYDTTDEDDAKFGVQLGCNGIVHILFEPLNAGAEHPPMLLLKEVMKHRRPAMLSTVFSLEGKMQQPGTCLFYAGEESLARGGASPSLQAALQQDARALLAEEDSGIIAYEWESLYAFHQFIPPPVALLIAGAGNDAMPLAALANLLGWELTLADGRSTHANSQRFPQAKNIVVAKPGALLHQVLIDKNTCCVLMSHNYNYDLALLKELSGTDAPYIGILGPKAKMTRMCSDLERKGFFMENTQRVHSPVGLDIGAETPEEIALSIAAEIKAVLMHKTARMLREKDRPVHSR